MSTSQIFESYVPVYDAVPEGWEDARPFLVEHLKKISNAINIREIGWFLDEELLSGKQFIPSDSTALLQGTAPQFRTVLRKVIDFGTLPNATTKSVPHGITFDNNFTLVQLYGAATAPGIAAIPIPFLDVINSPALNAEIYIDSTNVVIATTGNLSAYTRCFVTIEYIQEL